jgi:signal transduction histidine kinase
MPPFFLAMLLRPRAAIALCLLLGMLLPGLAPAAPQRILTLHSFNREFAPHGTMVTTLRSELEREAKVPIAFYDAALNADQAGPEEDTRPMLAFLQQRFEGRPPDLVICVDVPAARFYLQYRDRLFGSVPVLILGSEERLTNVLPLRPGDAAVGSRVEIPRLAENILQLRPATKTIFVVLGASTLERFWAQQAEREFAAMGDRVRFVFWNDLSLQEARRQVSQLPSDAAVLYALCIVDAAGIPHEHEEALAQLRAATTVPVFGVFEGQLGKGIVGGPLLSQQQIGLQSARVARAMLSHTALPADALRPVPLGNPVYDWRELQGWHIDTGRLPANSVVLHRPPGLFEAYRTTIIAGVAVVVLQGLLIFGLLVQRARRQHAEREAVDLSGRLITAHEDERRRIARELHDDLTQRLARLAIDAAQMEKGRPAAASDSSPHGVRDELVRLSEDVHALSYRLHPSMLDDLGLKDALQAECERMMRRESIKVELSLADVPHSLPASAALCLFRIAQEALRNVTRHSGARKVAVQLTQEDGGVRLAVADDGQGFDFAQARQHASLGLASMRERVRLVGGRLEIDSAPGRGTRIDAWVPVSKP